MKFLSLVPVLLLLTLAPLHSSERPSVLFIAIDDLNHRVGHPGRNEQAKTPNIDRFAAMGVAFTNAHCAVPGCEPSRLALMSGHKWKMHMQPGEGLSAQFLNAGYHVAGAGKNFHSMDHLPEEWSEYMPKKDLHPNGPGVDKYDGYIVEKTHPDLKDEDLLDWHSADYCIERMSDPGDQPFFIACGLYKPHLAFVAPRK